MREDLPMRQGESNQGLGACDGDSPPRLPGLAQRPEGPDVSQAVTYTYDARGDRVRPGTGKQLALGTTRFLDHGRAVGTDRQGAEADPACYVDSCSEGMQRRPEPTGRWFQEDPVGFDGSDADLRPAVVPCADRGAAEGPAPRRALPRRADGACGTRAV
jgi:hypothetical protein